MADRAQGVLPRQTFASLISAGFIQGIDVNCASAASLDLPLSNEAYRISYAFLPGQGRTVRSYLAAVGAELFDLSNRLEVGATYLVRIAGQIELPREVYGYSNPKSSAGRLNLLVRIVADNVAMYDALTPARWQGECWVLLQANSFPVRLSPGLSVSQLRLFTGPTFLSPLEVECAARTPGLFFHADGTPYRSEEYVRHADSLLIPLAIPNEIGAQIGWECRGSSHTLDFSKRHEYEPEDFFSPVFVQRDGSVLLRKGCFYILSTEPRICVPPWIAAELRAIDPRFGEYRTHTAGYIDPGWGYGVEGEGRGSVITLEFVMYEDTRFFLGDLRYVARIRYERMCETPDRPYGSNNPSYPKQGLGQLSRHFK